MSEPTKINEDQQKPAETPAAKPFNLHEAANQGYEIDVPEKLVEKPEPVAEKKPEPKVEKPKHSRLSVQLGLSLGIPQDMIDEASPAELTTAIAALSARQPERKPEPKKEEPAADEFDLGVDLDQFDETTQKVLKAQNDHIRKLAAKEKEREEREKAREEKLARLEMSEKQREAAAFNDAVDAAFNDLGDAGATIFGNGKLTDGTLDDAQARRRKMIVQSVDLSKCKDVKEAKKLIAAEAAAFAGVSAAPREPAPPKKPTPPKDPTTGKFVKEPDTDENQEQAIIEKWQRSQLPRPTHRETDDGLTPEQRAANRVKEVMQTAREVQPNGRQNGRETRL